MKTQIASRTSSGGFTLLEMLVTISIASTLIALTPFNYRALEDPVKNGSQALMGFMKKTRAKALASTRAYTIKAVSSRRVITTYGSTCSATQYTDSTLTLDLPSSAYMTDSTWSICYGTRGLSNSSNDITVTDGSVHKTVQVVLGGGIRVI